MSTSTTSHRVLAVVAIAAAIGAAVSAVSLHQAIAGPATAEPAASGASAPAGPTAKVQTVAVHQGPIAQLVHAWGSVTFSNTDQTTLSLPYAAQVTRLAVSVGQTVRNGMLLAEMTSDPAVTATYVQAQSTLKAAADELKRTQSLYDKQLATQSQLATAQKAASDAHTALDELKRQGAIPGAQRLLAPFDGVVITVSAAQGDRVAAGGAVMQVGRNGSAGLSHISLGVDPAFASRVRVGAPAGIAAVSGNAATPPVAYPGKVSAVRQALNPTSRLVDAVVELDPSAGAQLLPGTLVDASIELARSTHWIVPRSALLHDDKGDYVYQVVAGHARRVDVKKQVESGDSYGVDGPLNAELPVVTLGNYELDDGMAVAANGSVAARVDSAEGRP